MDDNILKEIMKKLENLESRLSALEKTPVEKTRRDGKKISIKEFLLDKNPSDDVQRTLIIGYYLEHFEGMNSFNTKDLAGSFRKAKERPPINTNDKVNMNIRKGYLMEAAEEKDGFKAWVLTNSGEKFVEGGIKG